jgi:hypothetical protein
VLITLAISCKEETKPNRLIDKEMMVNIMYDLSILQAVKYQNPSSIDSFKINARDFVYKKYRIDSLQFAQSNVYYSTDNVQYKEMFNQVESRINKEKTAADSLIKLEIKKKSKINTTKVKKSISSNDSLRKGREKLIDKNVIKKALIEEEALQ